MTQAPVPASDFADMQGLLDTGYSTLTEACFLLLRIADPAAARAWLAAVDVTTADRRNVATALQVALTVDGMQALGVAPASIAGFSRVLRPASRARKAARAGSAMSGPTRRPNGPGARFRRTWWCCCTLQREAWRRFASR